MATTFRFAEERDAAEVRAIYAPYCESTPVSFELVTPTSEEMAQRIRRTLEHFPWLVCEHDNHLAGYVYASRHRERAAYQWSVDVAVYVAPTCRRGGVGRGLYTSLLQILTLQGYYKAFAGVTLPNPASVGLHEAVGFEPVGVYRGVGYKLGAWHDVGWWQRTLRTEEPDPAPPRGIQEIRDLPAIQETLAAGRALVYIA